jgi:putative tryptophan/tyrosine transport system substrate-binding protein
MRRRDFIAAMGGAATWPIAARAQQGRLPVIGFLNATMPSAVQYELPAFHKGLLELGYAEGRNLNILYRWAETQYDRLPALAADFVMRRVDVIAATGGTVSAVAAKSATTSIPIVFQTGEDPVELGLVASLNRPGGNVTGASFLTVAVTAKRLQLLVELVPSARVVGALVNRTNPESAAQIKEMETAARILGVRLVIVNASTPNEIETAFASLVEQQVMGLLIGGDPLYATRASQLALLAARNAIPAIYQGARENVDAGGLVSYGANIADSWRLAGNYVGRILKGDKPSDLPVQQSTRIEMVLNLKTAKALGIEVPTATLLRATEVIE